ncbi:MAG: histidine--tRNA ligase, partial [Chloroflexota bacterium]|nr:histidine--tRNA ligase [Chloroflexota bacterium]
YGRIDTPIFEDVNVFLRTVGEETDIVSKEMYVFKDRGGQELALRPEGTAAVCRAYVEHGLHNQALPVRLFYYAPMFRYDRPQAGRYRQLHQFGAEAIGDSDPAIDLEIIQLAMGAIAALGLGRMTLVLNSIGDAADRPGYLSALRDYFRPHLGALGADDRRRFETNPLRLLDSKDERTAPLLDAAPRSIDYLGEEARAHWERLLGYLAGLGMDCRTDHRLVRGLDYYTRTVFEVHPDLEGAQSAVCAGGRYDGLVEQLGGPPTPGVGFAAGIDRLILNMQRQRVSPPTAPGPVALVAIGAAARASVLEAAAALRRDGIAAVVAPDRSMRAQLRYASALGASFAAIMGAQEMEAGTVTLRAMTEGTQREVARSELAAAVAAGLSGA